MNKQTNQRDLASAIRFGFYGARKLARMGHAKVARQFRATARRQASELRAIRAREARVDAHFDGLLAYMSGIRAQMVADGLIREPGSRTRAGELA